MLKSFGSPLLRSQRYPKPLPLLRSHPASFLASQPSQPHAVANLETFGNHGQLGGTETVGPVLSLEDNMKDLADRGARINAFLDLEGDAKIVNHALAMMIAEGNLKLCKMLVEEHGADVTLGMTWVSLATATAKARSTSAYDAHMRSQALALTLTLTLARADHVHRN